jgi:hypothetical protein
VLQPVEARRIAAKAVPQGVRYSQYPVRARRFRVLDLDEPGADQLQQGTSYVFDAVVTVFSGAPPREQQPERRTTGVAFLAFEDLCEARILLDQASGKDQLQVEAPHAGVDQRAHRQRTLCVILPSR